MSSRPRGAAPAPFRAPALALALLATTALLAAAAPPAQAQAAAACGALDALCRTTTTLQLLPPPVALPPTGTLEVPVAIEYTYPPLALTTAPTVVHLVASPGPGWVSAAIVPSEVALVLHPAGCACTQVAHAQAWLVLSAAGPGPAFAPAVVEVVAHARPNGNLAPSEGRAAVPVQLGYAGLVDLAAPRPHLALAPGDGGWLPLQVANHGNAATRVSFEVLEAPPGLRVVLPGEVTLGAEGDTAPAQRSVALGLEAPGAYEPGAVVLAARPAYALDPAHVGPAAVLSLHVSPPSQAGEGAVRIMGGTGGSAPAEPWTWALLAAGSAGVALLERARRRRAAR